MVYARPIEPREQPAARPRPLVLLVDDDPPLVNVLAESLKHRLGGDAVIRTCTSGESAVAELSASEYDVVVSDCLMPGMSGLELVERVRVLCPAALTILVTGAFERELTVGALRAGAYDFIQKPVDPDYFAASVRRAIETRRLRREVARQEIALRRHAEELERKVEERTRELQEAHRMKDAFLATLSHELLTPLTSILGWARLLRGGALDEPTRLQAVEAIHRNAKAQAQLIDDLLDISRIITGKLRLDIQQVDIAGVLDAAVDTILPAARAKRITVDTVIPRGIELTAADPDRLQQVFWNLLSNAVKYTEEGGHVAVKLELAGSQLEITVTDDGVGIAKDVLPFVFERLRQGAPAIHGQMRRGLGIGLSIVRYVVELHGGTVEASSEGPGKGASFKVRLPFRPVAVPIDRKKAQRSSNAKTDADGEPSRCLDDIDVLLVDDEYDTREVLGFMLRQSGANVTVATNAVEAMEALERKPPDLLLCDIGMPGEDGYSLIGRVRALPPERGGRVPAVALTAYARPEDGARALAAGFQLHMPKPGPSDMAIIVANLVKASRKSEGPSA